MLASGLRRFYAMSPEKSPPYPTVLISRARLEKRVAELARQINRDYRDSQLLVCIGVLKGSVFFMVDLLKQVEVPVAVDFFQTASYVGSTTRGEVRIRKDLDLFIRDRDVLLIEDIVDTGYTLRTILDLLRFRGAKSVKLCALLDKFEAREVEVPVDYSGFKIGNAFVVGYGLDIDERYRNLPFIGTLAEDSVPNAGSTDDLQ
jgi:hypoxanthine phosphoribosyltransferase